jgi:hypothetical protein
VERFDTGQEKVGATPHGSEGRQSGDFFSDWTLRDLKFECAVLVADDRIALIAQFMKITVISPDILRELELADQACADYKSCYAPLYASSGASCRK